MAETSFPFEDVDVSETQFSTFFTNLQDTGVKGTPTGTELLVVGDNSGLQVRVNAGQAIVRGHFYDNSLQLTLPIVSAGTNTRIDAIVLELDPTQNRIIAKVVQGTAVASNPSAPTLSQTTAGVYQMLLGYVTIPASTTSITAGMVTDRRPFMGQRVGIWTTATRPTNPVAQQTMGWNATLNYHEVWNGTAWVAFAPDAPSQFLLMGA